MGEVSSPAMTERARPLAKPHKLSDRITLTKSLPIAVRSALSHSACPLRRSRASSPKGRADTPGNFTGQPGTVPPPLKPSPTGGRWRVAPDEGQHQLPRRGSQGLKPIAKVLGIMRRLSAVLLALPLRKDFHPLRGKMSRSAFKIIPHKKAAAQNPVQQP